MRLGRAPVGGASVIWYSVQAVPCTTERCLCTCIVVARVSLGLDCCQLAECSCLTSVLPVQVVMYPSKSEGMFVRESLIFRSDSNGEDLEGYAGRQWCSPCVRQHTCRGLFNILVGGHF